MLSKQFPLNIIEGFYLAQIAHHFYHNGLLGKLAPHRSLKALAREFKYDEMALSAVLEFLYQSSDIVVRRGANRYSLNSKYHSYHSLGFLLEQFVGAYGPAVLHLEESLRSANLGRRFVDRQAHAVAFSNIKSLPNPIVMKLIREFKIR